MCTSDWAKLLWQTIRTAMSIWSVINNNYYSSFGNLFFSLWFSLLRFFFFSNMCIPTRRAFRVKGKVTLAIIKRSEFVTRMEMILLIFQITTCCWLYLFSISLNCSNYLLPFWLLVILILLAATLLSLLWYYLQSTHCMWVMTDRRCRWTEFVSNKSLRQYLFFHS